VEILDQNRGSGSMAINGHGSSFPLFQILNWDPIDLPGLVGDFLLREAVRASLGIVLFCASTVLTVCID
jgi:hypothetical protein